MSDTTNYFGSENLVNKKELKVLANYKDTPDEMISQVLDKLMLLYNNTKIILDAFDGKILPDEDPEDLEGLTKEEVISLIIEEPLEELNYSDYEDITKEIVQEYYFRQNYSFDIFCSSLMTIAKHLNDLKKDIQNIRPFDFDNKHRNSLEKAFYNLNYCILLNFKLMYLDEGEILSGVRSYITNHRLEAEDLVNPMLEIWREHKPDISYFNNNPEIFEDLEKVLDPKTLSELMNYVNVVEEQEWYDIINKKVTVDDEYLSMMEERYFRQLKDRIGDSYDD